jgi:hypothetical protein
MRGIRGAGTEPTGRRDGMYIGIGTLLIIIILVILLA